MESWPSTEEELVIGHDRVGENLARVRALLADRGLDALVVTSADRHLNEYTPRADNHRYFLSGFTGSTALMLIPREGRARLYVDGRYHLQADREVDAALVDVVKAPMSTMLMNALLEDLRGRARVGYEGDRVSQALAESIEEAAGETVCFERGEVGAALDLGPIEHAKPLSFIDPAISGRSFAERLAAVFEHVERPGSTVLMLSALDDIAWLTGGRGYHFGYQSSFAASGFATHDAVHLTVDEAVLRAGMDGAPAGVEWHAEAPEEVLRSSAFDAFDTIQYDAGQATAASVRSMSRVRPAWKVVARRSPVVAVKAVKTAAELAHFEAINERSSRAITKTIRWVRERLAAGTAVTEAGFYEAANGFYEAEGARDLSFHTIAAVGANSAVIHFSNPQERVAAAPGDLMLLDSGALYEGGFATDITRTFLAAGRRARASKEQKKIYTLVLKGHVRGMMATFPEGTRGSFLDAVIRAPLYEAGYDYAHGTGHGVGVHVHEPGVGISPSSALPVLAGHVCSIEPGIYIEGFGGVRLENVVVFEPHEEHAGYLRSRSLCFVGYDDNLVEPSLLDDAEREWLDRYRQECERRGTHAFEAGAP